MITEAPYHTQQGVENFQTWFGQSKVVDAAGQPLRVFHGCGYPEGFNDKPVFTNKAKEDAGNSWGDAMLGHFFTSSTTVANGFSSYLSAGIDGTDERMESDGATIPAYLSIQNPYRYTGDRFFRLLNSEYTNWKQIKRSIVADGHDGIIIDADPRIAKSDRGWIQFDAPTYIVFKSNQIKSAIGNNGKFNPKKNSIIEGTVKTFKEFIVESRTPNFFSRTHYRLPDEDDLIDIDRCHPTPKQIVDGFSYTIIGKGMRSAENRIMIIQSLEMLYSMFPKAEYARAIELYKESHARYVV